MLFRISLLRALLFILISTVVITGGAVGLWRHYRQNKLERLKNPDYYLTTLVQAPREALNPSFFEELFDLSVDQPPSCYAFDLEAAKNKLAALPVMRHSSVKVLPPHTLYIEYILRTPIAYLGNITNTLLDQEGIMFPAEPFFTPKRLPEFYLDLKDAKSFSIALAVTDELNGEDLRVERVDLSCMNAPFYGKREIVVSVRSEGVMHLLRLDSDDWRDGLQRYQRLRNTLQGSAIVDLRTRSMAFIKPTL